MTTLRAGWVITQRDLAHWVRQPWTPIFGLLFSIMLLLVFGFLFGGAITVPGGGDYITFLLPGMLALSMMFGVETTATAMANDARKGITDRFRSMPIGSASVALGRVGADMANSAVELLVLIARRAADRLADHVRSGVGGAGRAAAALPAVRGALDRHLRRPHLPR